MKSTGRSTLSLFVLGLGLAVAPCSAQSLQGDLNGDGVVNTKDALRLYRIVKGQVTATAADKQAGDVYPLTGTGEHPFGDGKLDRDDVRQLLRVLVGAVSQGEITGRFEAPEIISFDPPTGAAGTTVTITGKNFMTGEAAKKTMLVTFGATPAAAFTAVSTTEIQAVVPDGIASEYVVVTTPGGEARSSAPFLSAASATGKVVLPAAMQGATLEIASVMGDGTADQQGNYTAPTFADYPTLLSATPAGRPNSPFFRILFPGSRQASDREINARSTAESLILMQPVFALLGVDNWPLLIAKMHGLPEVDHLAKVIEQVWPQSPDPLNDPALETALTAAMDALADALIASAPTGKTARRAPSAAATAPPISSRSRIVWPDAGFTDIDWDSSNPQPKTISAKLNFGSPVDYLVRVARLKLDKIDSQTDLLNGLKNGQTFERERFSDFTLIPATQVTAEILGKAPLLLNVTSANVLGTIGGVGDLGAASALPSPGSLDLDPSAPNAVYVIRSFAGVLWDKSPDGLDSAIIARIPLGTGDHVTAVVYNLMLVAWDVVTLFVPQLNALPSSVVAEVLKEATIFLRGQVQTLLGRQNTRSASDLAKTLYRFAAESVRIIFKEFQKPGLYNRTLTISGKVPKVIKKTLAVSNLKVTQIISNIVGKSGSIERVLGMAGVQIPGFSYVSLTPLESAYLVVGHPFGPSIRSFTPTKGVPGDTVSLEGYGFSAAPADNTVRLGSVKCDVKEVTPRDPNKGGPDKMKVTVPAGAPPGAWRFSVQVPGSKVRHSSKYFSVGRAPVAQSATPPFGFAPGKLGFQQNVDAQGTRVTIDGSFFDPQADTVFFENPDGSRIAATVEVVISTSTSLVVEQVPAGAVAGKGAFVVKSPKGIESKVAFTVLGPPTLQSVQPGSAQSGGALTLTGANIPFGHPRVTYGSGRSVDPLLVWFSFNNQQQTASATMVSETRVQATMTGDPNPGDTIQVYVQTPAGLSNPVTVTRLAGRTAGSTLAVPASNLVKADGTISFAEAAAWIQGRAPEGATATDPYTPPFDDFDVDLTIIITKTYQQVEGKPDKFISEVHTRGAVTTHARSASRSGSILLDPTQGRGHSGHETAYVTTKTIKHLIPLTGDPIDIPQGTTSSTVDLDDPKITTIDVWTRAQLPTLGVVEEGDDSGLAGIGKEFSDTLSFDGTGNDKVDLALDEPGAGGDVITGAGGSFGTVLVRTDRNTLRDLQADSVEFRSAASKAAGRQATLAAAHNILDASTVKQLTLDGATDTIVASTTVDGKGTTATGILVTNGAQRNVIKGTPLDPDGYPHWGKTAVRNCAGAGIRVAGANTAFNRFESLYVGFLVTYDSTKPTGKRYGAAPQPCGTGIEVVQGAHDNRFVEVAVRSCTGDGVRLSGAGVRNNTVGIIDNFLGNSYLGIALNGANGVHLQSGASENHVEGSVFKNGEYGVLVEGTGTDGNEVSVNGASNGAQLQVPYDVVVQGDGTTSPVGAQVTYGRHGAWDDATLVTRGVHLHGLRLPAGRQSAGSFTCLVQATEGAVELSDTQYAIVGPTSLEGAMFSGNVLLRGKNTQHNLIRNMFFLNTAGTALRLTDGASHNEVHTFLMRNWQGFGIPSGPYGIVLDGGASDNEIIGADDLGNNRSGVGIGDKQTALLISGGAKNNVVRNVLFSPYFTANVNDHDVIVEGHGTQGNIIRNCTIWHPLIVRDGAQDTTFNDNLMEFGVSQDVPIQILGPGTEGVFLYANKLYHDPNTPQTIISIDNASRVEVGSNSPGQGNRIPCPKNGAGIGIDKSDAVRIVANTFSGKGSGIYALGGAREITVGGGDAADGNTFAVDGIDVNFIGVTDSVIQNNRMAPSTPPFHDVAVRLEGGCQRISIAKNDIAECVIDGIQIDGAATTNNFVLENTIKGNGGQGVHLTNGARLNTIRRNSIYANDGLGIFLENNSNDGLSPAVIGSYDPKTQTVSGTAPSDIPESSTIEFFADSSTQGEIFLGIVPVRPQRKFDFELHRPLPPGMNLTATVTDPAGNTSQFAIPLNPAPTRPKAFFLVTTSRFGNRDILRMFPGEAVGVPLTTDPGQDDSPALSPDHQQVLWVSNRDGDAEIWRMSSDGVGATNLTNNGVDDYDPAWSPDGTKIAYVSTGDGNPEIWVMNADGSNPKQITHTEAGVANRHPTWNPDGTQIAYASGPDSAAALPGRQAGGNWEVMIVGANGGGGTNITNHPAADDQPAWSPDGKLLAFVTNRDGNPEIYVVQPGGGGLKRLTDDPAEDITPAWVSAQVLLFASKRSGKYEIYSMRQDGGSVLRLTVSLGLNIQPNAGKQ